VAAPSSSAIVRDAHAPACRTLDDAKDPAFNELNGINDRRAIAGDDGLGYGYVAKAPYRQKDYRYEGYPGSDATVVSAIDDSHDVAGFYRRGANIFGFLHTGDGLWLGFRGPGKIYEILGLNAIGSTVGFYTDRHGIEHAFGPNGKVRPPGAVDVVAAGINAREDIAGYLTTSGGSTEGFFFRNGAYSEFLYPGSAKTEAFGINRRDEIVGSYIDASGATHGFILRHPAGNPRWQSFDEPNAAGLTILRGLNDHGDLVGSYLDGAGHTNGFLCE
jgi:hypothetical protein